MFFHSGQYVLTCSGLIESETDLLQKFTALVRVERITIKVLRLVTCLYLLVLTLYRRKEEVSSL